MPARICPAWGTGYILSTDLHMVCEGCLGPNHADQAMTAEASCLACGKLPVEEKQRRVAPFTDQDEGFELFDSVPLNQLIDF